MLDLSAVPSGPYVSGSLYGYSEGGLGYSQHPISSPVDQVLLFWGRLPHAVTVDEGQLRQAIRRHFERELEGVSQDTLRGPEEGNALGPLGDGRCPTTAHTTAAINRILTSVGGATSPL